jgi:phosphoserine phosphatase RsbU/P
MVIARDTLLREQLVVRRQKLLTAIVETGDSAHLLSLLKEVDTALGNMEEGTYGYCEVCHDPVETERLIANPLERFCLGHLSPRQQKALEQDLMLAARIQAEFLPKENLSACGWEISYHYEGAGPVSGDYCDVVTSPDGRIHFMLGDVSGKGVAASMLMSQLHAMFRTLISIGLPLDQIVERASRVFCSSTLPTQFATLVCVKARGTGEVEICNAGHNPPLLIQGKEIKRIDATGLPMGMFCNEEFTIKKMSFKKNSTLVLYTDGITESKDPFGTDYGLDRLERLVSHNSHLSPRALVEACMEDLTSFRSEAPKTDDMTLMIIRRTEERED